MSFLLLFLCGIAGGVLGGMGMGGGTALIPLLTIVCGLEQSAAQAINLLSFAPMAAVALSVHAKNGLLEKRGIVSLAVPAVVFSVLGAFFAARLPSRVLSKAFGVFLIFLSFYWLKNAAFPQKKSRNS